MQLPVDITALIEEIMNIDSVKDVNLSVSVYIDSKAPADVVAHIRSIFASSLPTVRMTLSYLDNTFAPHEGDDLAVIVAGESRTIGSAAAVLRAAEIPVAIVTTLPATVERIAAEGKHAIPDGDIVSPVEYSLEPDGGYNPSGEPIELTDELATSLDERLGRWIIAVSYEKRQAFAIAFPFMRRCLAIDSVQATSLQNAAIGLIPIIPGSDLPIMTLNQAKMILQIASAYGHTLDKDRVLEIASVVGSAYVFRTVARLLIGFVPVLGFIVRPGVAYGGTAAVGNAAIGYFEEGKDVGGIVKVASNAAKKLTNFIAEARRDPQATVAAAYNKASAIVPMAQEKVNEYVPVARDLAAEYVPKAKDMVQEYIPVAKQAVSDVVSSVKAGAADSGQ